VTILHRYLLKQSLFILGACLAIGVGVYLLADLFDRLENFLEAGLSAVTILTYFAVKIPLIVSQILPAVFLISTVLQLSVMSRNRELLALQAGGISYARQIVFFIGYGLAWGVLQLFFSQFVGVYGEQEASRIWKEEVRKTQLDKRVMTNVWFKEGRWLIKLDEALPSKRTGKGVTIYELSTEGLEWEKIVRAGAFEAEPNAWILHDVEEWSPKTFAAERFPILRVELKQDLKAFIAMDPHRDPTQLPLWQLGQVIDDLSSSGSNVEGLRTIWHMKLSYAFSILVMGLLALALSALYDNVYLNIALALLLTFAFYGLTVVFVSAGQKGFMAPAVAAWLGDALVCVLASGLLLWRFRRA
jgi:lipopolysaccharide export system permease protein